MTTLTRESATRRRLNAIDTAEPLLSAADNRSQPEELISLTEDAVARVGQSDASFDAVLARDGESSEAEMRAANLTASAHYSPTRPQTKAAIPRGTAAGRSFRSRHISDAVVETARSLRE